MGRLSDRPILLGFQGRAPRRIVKDAHSGANIRYHYVVPHNNTHEGLAQALRAHNVKAS